MLAYVRKFANSKGFAHKEYFYKTLTFKILYTYNNNENLFD